VVDRGVLRRIERELRAQVCGRVLDLGDLGRHSTLDDLVTSGERFDSIVSMFQLSRSRDPARDVRAVERLLAEGGRLFLLEPTASVGVAKALHRLAGRRDHDIPAILRGAGLSMSICERIAVNRVWPARMYVEGIAFRTLHPAQPAIGSGGAAPGEVVGERSERTAGARAPASRTLMGSGGAAPGEL
jgi:SAM-dependent methyltransferase